MGTWYSIIKEWITGEQQKRDDFETLLRQYTYAVEVEQEKDQQDEQTKSYLLQDVILKDTDGYYNYSEIR